jgi:hypothetical protein
MLHARRALHRQRQPLAALPRNAGPLLERAIGVIYRPRTERQSHYFYSELPKQFDIVVHIDQTTGEELGASLPCACLRAPAAPAACCARELTPPAAALPLAPSAAAVTPLEPAHPSWEAEHEAKEDLPETYPFAV